MTIISFHSEYPDFLPDELGTIAPALDKLFESEQTLVSQVDCILLTEADIIRINREFLSHEYSTDIITFNYANTGLPVQGELYICLDAVHENSIDYGSSFSHELCRVVIHGCLHLCGYDDRTPEEKSRMTQKENHYLLPLDIPELFFPPQRRKK